MKSLVLLAILIFNAEIIIGQVWMPVGSNLSIGEAGYTSIAIDSSGNPYVTYINTSQVPFAEKYMDSSWIQLGNADFSGYLVVETTIAISPGGMPYNAFINTGGTNDGGPVAIIEYNGNNWQAVGDSVEIDQNFTVSPSIAFGSNGLPYVAFAELLDNCCARATVMQYTDSGWVALGGHGFSSNLNIDFVDLAINREGTPYIVYSQIDSGQIYGGVTVMKYTGSDWVTVGNPGFSSGYVLWPTIAIGSNDTLYVAYENFVNGLQGVPVTVMKFNGTNWVGVGGDTLPTGVASFPFLAIDSTNTPYVIYRDSLRDYKATVMKFDGSNWVNVGNPGFSAGDARFCTMAIDRHGIPYIAYEDLGNGGKATVMKYVADNTGINSLTPNNLTISSNPSSGIFHISFAEKITAMQVFDVEGRLMMENYSEPINNNNTIINLEGKAKGVYFLRATTADGIINGKLVVE